MPPIPSGRHMKKEKQMLNIPLHTFETISSHASSQAIHSTGSLTLRFDVQRLCFFCLLYRFILVYRQLSVEVLLKHQTFYMFKVF